MKRNIILIYIITWLLILLQPASLFARIAPVTTAGSAAACPGGTVAVPITVTGFTSIKGFTLRLDYDPTQLTFLNYTNVNPVTGNTTVNNSNISPTLSRLMMVWTDLTARTLPNGSKLLDLNFTLVSGSPVIAFNNTSNGGGDCEYADETGAAMTDTPTSTYYFNSTITTNGCGAAGTITGAAVVCAGSSNVGYSVPPITNATGYTWTVPAGGLIISGNNTNSILVNYSTSAVSGNVTVNGTNNCGPGLPSSLAVVINPLPVPGITGAANVCAGSPGNVYTTEAGMTGYQWTVSGGGIVTAGGGPTHNTVTVTWYNTTPQSVGVNYMNPDGCSAQNPTVQAVTVNPAPVPAISGPTEACEGSSGVIYTTEATMLNYTWTISWGGAITSGTGTNSIAVSWNNPGAQFVRVNYSNGFGCTGVYPTLYAVTVSPLPGSAGVINGSSDVCAGANGIPYSIPAIANASSYSWSLPEGASMATGAGTENITVDFSSAAVPGNITVNGINPCGNGTSSPAFPVTISQMPGAAGSISGPDVVCAGTNGVIYSVPAIANATSYNWTIPAGVVITSGANTSQIVVSFSATPGTGVFTVQGSSACGSGAVSPDFVVDMIASQGAPVVTATGPLLTSSVPTGNQWYYEGTGAIQGATGQTYTASITGWYWTVVLGQGCPTLESNHVYVLFVGQEELQNDNFKVYPVPGDGRFNVSMATAEPGTCTILVFNQIGEKIYERDDIPVDGAIEYQIDLRPVPVGLYSVVFLTNNHTFVRKVLVK